MSYPELRSDDPEEIVKLAARQLADKLNIPVVVEDSGFFIKCLNGFPGTCTAYVFKRIGCEGILKVVGDLEDRTCFYKSAIGFCEPHKEPVTFFGQEEGIVAKEIRGNRGWGQDPIFIPTGNTKTYGEIREENMVNTFRFQSVKKLKEFLLK